MTEQTINQLVANELVAQRLAVTKQYLDVHQVLYKKGIPVIERITPPDSEGIIKAYLPVQGEKFYLVFYLDANTGGLNGLSTEAWNRVYLRATSSTLSASELAAFTTLQPSDQWSKGDARRKGQGVYSFSSISFLPNPEPDTFEHKLSKLLEFLEQDANGVQRLVEQADCGITVAIDMHNGNGMLGGPFIDARNIKRMAALDLDIEFDLYATGNAFKE
ncbi:DUF4279 domain-containing protein [Hymenobacter busanensis]|uniref:DUF4279 domain-containing protein n=1 Tax=Hymenobacter busanensis TaxID=2607656 RepID=A0A7L4ZV62_9BACT|nr:DUF4279 domain-containing protein [Hymenobacter busanensis]KAA9332339.1 DUF4279 domain-containing protein [Hymenobacter busanensis]QHJ07324.1 DUF4279 domain-containing protein [Hymenobacter busanensis]